MNQTNETDQTDRVRILFLCTGNSARSIMAEAIANEMFGDTLEAYSAGSKPKSEPNPLALEALRMRDLPTEAWRSKNWDEHKDTEFDLVVTLCDCAAKEECPTFPGAPLQVHWGFPDPPAAGDTAAQRERFQEVFEGLNEAIGAFAANVHEHGIEAAAHCVKEMVVLRFPEAVPQ